jgi:hypothetical protein
MAVNMMGQDRAWGIMTGYLYRMTRKFKWFCKGNRNGVFVFQWYIMNQRKYKELHK